MFMIAYYKLAGVIACVSLLLNVFLLWAGMLFLYYVEYAEYKKVIIY